MPAKAKPPRAKDAAPRPSTSLLTWSIFEGGRGAYAVLVSIYVFIPYVAATLTGDPIKGQHLVAELAKWGGLAAAVTAPFVGVTIDHLGPRKPGLVILSAVCVPLAVALWWASPDHTGLNLGGVAWLLASIGVLFGLSEVLHNSMLVYATNERERPAASGIATAIGNIISVSLMLFVLWAFMLPQTVHAPWVPARPLFGLDPATHQPERAMGPLSAIVLVISVVPLLLFARDAPRTGVGFLAALRLGARDLKGLAGVLNGEKNARNYLFARLIFADGQAGLAMFSGVFAAGIFGWGGTQLLIEGLLCMICAIGGGYLASILDRRVGPKASLVIAITATLLILVWQIGLAKDHIFYVFKYDPAVNGRPWHGSIFNTWPEWSYIAADMTSTVFFITSLASARTMMAQLAPPERTASFFGLYALAGRVTAWLCPMLVGMATATFHSQQIGLAPAGGLLLIGMLGLLAVKAPPRSAPHEASLADVLSDLPDATRDPNAGATREDAVARASASP